MHGCHAAMAWLLDCHRIRYGDRSGRRLHCAVEGTQRGGRQTGSRSKAIYGLSATAISGLSVCGRCAGADGGRFNSLKGRPHSLQPRGGCTRRGSNPRPGGEADAGDLVCIQGLCGQDHRAACSDLGRAPGRGGPGIQRGGAGRGRNAYEGLAPGVACYRAARGDQHGHRGNDGREQECHLLARIPAAPRHLPLGAPAPAGSIGLVDDAVYIRPRPRRQRARHTCRVDMNVFGNIHSVHAQLCQPTLREQSLSSLSPASLCDEAIQRAAGRRATAQIDARRRRGRTAVTADTARTRRSLFGPTLPHHKGGDNTGKIVVYEGQRRRQPRASMAGGKSAHKGCYEELSARGGPGPRGGTRAEAPLGTPQSQSPKPSRRFIEAGGPSPWSSEGRERGPPHTRQRDGQGPVVGQGR
mmetsp:Transcript_28452/g.90635  ORF Transcript_28452/g.90635 Transcript_28452/m.90635 type:complete len:412 (-) Transcript_28452:736-1971(-)